MTRADEYYQLGMQIAKKGDPSELARYIAQFFKRVQPADRQIVSVCAYTGLVELRIRSFRKDEDEIQSLTWRKEGNRWDGSRYGQLADADVASYLGVPMSYLNGFMDAAQCVPDIPLLARRFYQEELEHCHLAREELKDLKERTIEERLKCRRSREKYLEKRRTMTDSDIARAAADAARRRERQRNAERMRKLVDTVRVLEQQLQVSVSQRYPHEDIPAVLSPVRGVAPVDFDCRGPGVYFLVDTNTNKVNYVGQSSVSVVSRIVAHHHLSGWNWAGYLSLPLDLLDETERKWIDFFLPRHNGDSRTAKLKRTTIRSAQSPIPNPQSLTPEP